jgi:hypothetical protein
MFAVVVDNIAGFVVDVFEEGDEEDAVEDDDDDDEDKVAEDVLLF